jgi:hypothetical protein
VDICLLVGRADCGIDLGRLGMRRNKLRKVAIQVGDGTFRQT